MFSSPNARLHRLRQRAAVVAALRQHLDGTGSVEVQAPLAVRSPGLEPHLRSVALQVEGPRRFLHTSPEYALKRLVGAGLERVHSLGPCFRDEPRSATHSPEFTMLEFYATGLDLAAGMDAVEALVRAAAHAVPDGPVSRELIAPEGTARFARCSVRDAFSRFAGVDLAQARTPAQLRSAARAAGLSSAAERESWDEMFFQILLDRVEPALAALGPVFLHRWPASQAALARLDPVAPEWALRFELYAGGLELANAFDELTDPEEQRGRFEADRRTREALGEAAPPIDEALLAALGAMPPTFGVAIGVDRLVMWLVGAAHIDEVLVQPWDGP